MTELESELARITWVYDCTVTCVCGHTYRSPTLFSRKLGRLLAKKPCPVCKGHFACRASSDPESWSING